MNFKYLKSLVPVAALALTLGLHSCINDLDVTPIDPSTKMDFDRDAVFNKVYATLGLTGQKGADGDGDVDDIDEGTSAFYRMTWCANELVTDEAIVAGWNDPGLPSLISYTWGASNEITTGAYYRLNFDITLCNWFLENTADETSDEEKVMRAEVRFMRALNYFYLMDLFGDVPFSETVEYDVYPQQIKRADLFAYIEDELINKAEPNLKEPKTNTYGRVDKAAAWLLLARMYLNAEVYTGTAKWTEAATYAEKVMKSQYSLCKPYKHLFMADNGGAADGNPNNLAPNEVILPILQDGAKTRSWGVSHFLIAGTHKKDMTNYGSAEEWKGPRCCETLVAKFFPNTASAPFVDETEMTVAAKDDRALMFGKGRTVSTGKNKDFAEGFSCAKFTNVRADGGQTSDSAFPDMDVPFMRAAEAYLTYAEAVTRGAGGTVTPENAADAINELRKRANAEEKDAYTLEQICDEWAREFYFEGRRRMDLIRFGKFAGQSDYNWDWKGGSMNGTSFPEYRNLYPIPANDLNANPNLKQNPGY